MKPHSMGIDAWHLIMFVGFILPVALGVYTAALIRWLDKRYKRRDDG